MAGRTAVSRDVNVETFREDMSKEEVMLWLQKKLNRKPEATDFYNAGRELYQLGAYRKAASLLEFYIELPGAQLPGRHLLGYSYYMNGEIKKAALQFRLCVQDGFDGDWQLLVEICKDLDAKGDSIINDAAEKLPTSTRRRSAMPAVPTLPKSPGTASKPAPAPPNAPKTTGPSPRSGRS